MDMALRCVQFRSAGQAKLGIPTIGIGWKVLPRIVTVHSPTPYQLGPVLTEEG